MQPGLGAWVRVREGHVVKCEDDGDSDGSTDSFVALPTAAILRQQSALERFMLVSSVDVDEQAAVIVHEGRALALNEVASMEMVMNAQRDPKCVRAYMIASCTVHVCQPRLPPLGMALAEWRLLRLLRRRVCRLETPGPSYFRASASRRPLSSGGEVELGEVGVVSANFAKSPVPPLPTEDVRTCAPVPHRLRRSPLLRC